MEYTKNRRRRQAEFSVDNAAEMWYDSRCKVFALYNQASKKGVVSVKSQAYRMAMLFDFYGDVLTPRQKEFYDLYYNEDLSLSEIAENSGITRQGVRDVIVRAEAVLTDLEDKTGLIRRFHAMRGQLEEIRQDAQAILNVNNRYDDPELERLAERIRSAAEALQKE